MKKYAEDDLRISTDAISVIRRNPRMYLNAEVATGEHLATQMMATLIWLGAFPATASRLGSWWLISSGDDWLAKSDQADVEAAFSRIIPLSGLTNSHRSEVLLSAFAEAVVTSGTDGTKWVSSDASRLAPPDGLELAHPPGGRTVAFRLEGSANN